MKFLTVDDAKVLRTILKTIVENYNPDAVVLEATNGEEGLKILSTNPDVQMVFVDWNMPVLNGYELVKRIRANEIYKNLKIIMATTESGRDKVTEAAKIGINGYIIKPFSQEIVEKVIKKYFEAK